ELLEAGRRTAAPGEPDESGESGVLDALDRLSAAARHCDLAAVTPLIGAALRRLREAGVPISDRRAVRSQRLVAAAAAPAGRTTATAADLWVLPLIAPDAAAQALARDSLADLLEHSANSGLLHAAEELSRGARARAERLARTGADLIARYGATPADRDTRL